MQNTMVLEMDARGINEKSEREKGENCIKTG